MSCASVRRVIMGAAVVFATLAPRSADAQCGATVSSCRQCHELGVEKTLRGADPWHQDHAFGDLCSNCHGGDRASGDLSLAHLGIVDPLENGGERCRGCHAEEHAAVAGYLDRRVALSQVAINPRAPRPAKESAHAESGPRTSARANNVLGSAASLLAILGSVIVAKDWRRRGSPCAVRRFRLRDLEWSPYVAGALLGLVVAVSMVVFGHRLSGGGAYQYVAGVIGRAVAPRSSFFRFVVPARADWELVVVCGAALGAFVAARSSGAFRIRAMPDSGWQEAFGSRVWVRWVIAFFGAAMTEFAAGLAGGCTASLAVSGGAALAPGAFVFMAGMFAGGVPTAWWIYRRVTS
jgi:hypothetical protein